ncbi:RUSD3 synthase, partial [Edolisoma coerulescens]|nr:RUSD3 synthase [Edolisoma coerulescens]
GALLALSKPPGLPILGRPGDLSLDALLPALRRRLGLAAELHVVKAPAREYSGLVLLSSCYHTTKKLQQFFTNARLRGQYPATYRAVTAGVPAEVEGEIRTGLCWQQHGDRAMVRGCRRSGGTGGTPGSTEGCALQVVPVLAPGRHSLARKDVKSTLTRYRVLGAVGGCALLQLQPRTGEWPPTPPPPQPCFLTPAISPSPSSSPAFPEQLQVHLTLLLCPALGDHEHSSRVGTVLGVPFLLTPKTAPTRTQVLDEELLSRLGLSPWRLRHLPLHIHLQELVLP